jgi:hypothetical protein
MKLPEQSKEWWEKFLERDDWTEVISDSPFDIPEWMFGSSIEARNAIQNSGRVKNIPYTYDNPDCRAIPRVVEDEWVCHECSTSNSTSDKIKEKKFYIICESYTDHTQFEGSWDIVLEEFNSLQDAKDWIEQSEYWKEAKQYERICLGPLMLVEN